MASLIQDKNGTYRVQVLTADGQRVTIRLGRGTSPAQADTFKTHVELVQLAQRHQTAVPSDTARWVLKIDDRLHKGLVRAGLAEPRGGPATLGDLLERFFADLDVKPGTATHYGHTRRCLTAYFGASRGLATITEADADGFRQYLREQALRVKGVQQRGAAKPAAVVGLSPATVARRVKVARQIFRRAVRWKMVPADPFAEVKAGQQVNPARQRFITREDTQAIIDACPGPQWRLIVALARYGGLRCPSEILRLTWEEVLWSRNRIWVPSPKTEHHAGKDHRMIPLYPELRPYLLEVFEAAEPGTERVITEYPVTTPNLRTQLHRIMRRAGLTPGVKMWQNMRSTRETELAERWPIHLVCKWMGNTRAVAQEHYLQVRDSDFDQAAQAIPESRRADARLTQSCVATAANDCNDHRSNRVFAPLQAAANDCKSLQDKDLGPEGFEPPTKRL